MNEYKTDEYFLYESFKHDRLNFTQMIRRFFGARSSGVMSDIFKMSADGKHPNKYFYDTYSKYVKPYTKEEIIADYERSFRGNSRQEKFIKAIDKLFHTAKVPIPKDIIYLDYGCNDGMFALAVAKHFKIPAKNVYCVDIIEKPYIVDKAGFNYIKLDLNDIQVSLEKLPECNLVTIVNVIHHIPFEERDQLFKILDKKIKSESAIIIKEHDCGPGEYNHKYAMYIAEWHNMYKVLYNESNEMGKLYLMNVDQLSAYMMLMHANLKTFFHEHQDDILKAYYALFIKA
jgi:2-polyprenyl-3-methyl-5-hydroxy-6-metoxy-1,4-benzoquinol methylase